ncbi:MAG: PhoPQ-activated pathogenicity-like protein PqaA type [Caldiserica bacterium]|nr:PhoPQ-activated pathogenicity-like protein PqaA type [Caldisericota bacterium]
MRVLALAGFSVLLAMGTAAGPFPETLFRYLEGASSRVSWEIVRGAGRVHELALRSQVWRGIPWEHRLFICEPQVLRAEDVVFLFIAGDYDVGDEFRGLELARALGFPVALLFDIPVQPLFGRREDDLIAYTFRRYLEEGDPDWPLLFPMVQGAAAAMRAVRAFGEGRWGRGPTKFIVSGASKRGWTTYLVAAALPEEILGIVPMVFDILNIPVQLEHQRDFWGALSPMLSPYVEQGLFEEEGNPRWHQLLWLVDPYSYRHRLTMPKLIVLGTNDAYWPVDALSLYWAGLPGPKHVLYVPNAGHSLGDGERALGSVVAFARALASGLPLPELRWEVEPGATEAILRVRASGEPESARLWIAMSSTRDFRGVRWEERPLRGHGGSYVARIPRPGEGWCAFTAELIFPSGGTRLVVSTPAYVYP